MMGSENLSTFQLFKIPYIIHVLSIKYAGIEFLPEVTFFRDKNGPISMNIYSAINNLRKKRFIDVNISQKDDYPHERHCHKLNKKISKWSFSNGEIIFLDNLLSELLPLSLKKLKEYAYNTEPMKNIVNKERKEGIIKKGVIIDFSTVTVDPDAVNAFSDTTDTI